MSVATLDAVVASAHDGERAASICAAIRQTSELTMANAAHPDRADQHGRERLAHEPPRVVRRTIPISSRTLPVTTRRNQCRPVGGPSRALHVAGQLNPGAAGSALAIERSGCAVGVSRRRRRTPPTASAMVLTRRQLVCLSPSAGSETTPRRASGSSASRPVGARPAMGARWRARQDPSYDGAAVRGRVEHFRRAPRRGDQHVAHLP